MSCYVDGVFSDKIDQSISAMQLVLKCALCGSVYQKSKIKCDICSQSACITKKTDVQINTGKSKKSSA